jgi:Mor family transcriptional regulator
MRYNGIGRGPELEKNEVFEELEEAVGTEVADHLADLYSGSNLYIPRRVISARKYRRIRQEYKDGADYRGLARRYGYSERHVRRIIHEKN